MRPQIPVKDLTVRMTRSKSMYEARTPLKMAARGTAIAWEVFKSRSVWLMESSNWSGQMELRYVSIIEQKEICTRFSYLTVRHTMNAWHNSTSLNGTFLNSTCPMTVQFQSSTCHQTYFFTWKTVTKHIVFKAEHKKILYFPSHSVFPVLPVPFCLSRSACLVLPVPFCPSGSACPVLPVLFCLSRSACPVLPFRFCLSRSACPFLPVPFCLSRSACPVLAVSASRPFQAILLFLSCPGYPILAVLSWHHIYIYIYVYTYIHTYIYFMYIHISKHKRESKG
jgi:hypothetical protein